MGVHNLYLDDTNGVCLLIQVEPLIVTKSVWKLYFYDSIVFNFISETL
jgi:hypothetical protein